MRTINTYSVTAVLSNIGGSKELEGYKVNMNSKRYHCFLESLTCSCCGLEGTFFKLEQALDSNPDRAHFNLYAENIDGEHILFTKDHIIPRHAGGSNTLSNLQTMCQPCNSKKGHTLKSSDLFNALKKAAARKKGLTLTYQQIRKLLQDL